MKRSLQAMTGLRRCLGALSCCLIPAAVPPARAGGLADPLDYAAFNSAVVEQYVLPRYAGLEEATARLAESLKASCADGRVDEGESRAEYHAAMDAWMAVQHLRFGPSELFLRAERLEFWPDKRGTVRRHLAQMLSDRDPSTLSPEHFANGSVAVQGFPALERLLFDSDDMVWATPFGCDLVVTIGDNLHKIASELSSDWREGPSPYAETIRGAAEGGNETYFDAKEAALEFAKSLRGALLLVSDYKLDRPLGDNPKAARVTRAESWRSARSLRNVRVNLKAAQVLYGADQEARFSALVRSRPQGRELDDTVRAAFQRLIRASEALPDSFEAALAAPEGWQKLDDMRRETRQLLELLGGPLSQVLDLPMGFNSYDGD